MTPKVTVQMPAFNSARYIGAAIESVLAQTFSDFELLVIDDGSTDETADRVRAFDDSRVRLVHNDQNLGLPETRQRGIELARGEFIAFLDSDDVARPERLEKQVAFLERHPSCEAVGGWAQAIDAEGHPLEVLRKPTGPDAIRARLLFRYCFKNTTMMARRRIFDQYAFRPEFRVSQDVDLWVRIGLEHELDNLPEILSLYRQHPGGISKREPELTRQARIKISADQLERLGIAFDEDDLECHDAASHPERAPRSPEIIGRCADWLRRLLAANRVAGLYPESQFRRAVGEQWALVCLTASPSWPQAVARLLSSPLAWQSGLALTRDPALVLAALRLRSADTP